MTVKPATEKVGEYTVSELTLGQYREIARDNPEAGKDSMQYLIACKCVTKANGQFITMEELDSLGLRKATKLLQAVTRINATDGEGDEEGNA